MFITYEGIEGAGKSTQLALLASRLQSLGHDPLCTREPGGCALGRNLRAMLLDCRQAPVAPYAELCLFLADRAQHLAEEIRPALEAGRPILCDRYIDSTFAYQGYGRGMDLDKLRLINQLACDPILPDITILLDLDAAAGLGRAGQRNRVEGTVFSEGRFDSESMNFHQRVRNGYLELARAEPDRIKVIDASMPADAIFAVCQKLVMDVFENMETPDD